MRWGLEKNVRFEKEDPLRAFNNGKKASNDGTKKRKEKATPENPRTNVIISRNFMG